MQAEKLEDWFVSSSSREYFSVQPTASPSANKLTKNLSTGIPVDLTVRWIAKYVFSISEALKMAVSFSTSQCIYAMLLLWGNSKHGFTVA